MVDFKKASMINRLTRSSLIVLDTETTGIQPSEGARAFKIGIENEEGDVLIAERGTGAWRAVKDIAENPKIEKVCHNTKFDFRILRHEGWDLKGIWHDTMIMGHILNEYSLGGFSLEALSKNYIPATPKEADPVKEHLKLLKKQRMKMLNDDEIDIFYEPLYSHYPPELLDEYLERDLDTTLRLFWIFKPIIDSEFADLYDWERRLIPCVAIMEDAGIRINLDFCRAVIRRQTPKMEDALQDLFRIAGKEFNPNSPKQLLPILQSFGYKGTSTGKDALVIENFKHPIITALHDYKLRYKIINSHFAPMLEKAIGEILHCSFWQIGQEASGVKTGRFSSSNLNLQSIPGGYRKQFAAGDLIRKAFIPREGYVFIMLDFSQIEARIFADYAADQGMLDAFLKGEDVYRVDMIRLWNEDVIKNMTDNEFKKSRGLAKTVRLAMQYGMGVRKLAMRLDMPEREARAFRNNYLKQNPRVNQFIKSTQGDLYRNGYVKDIFGRKYRVPIKLSYKAVAARVQGSAANVIKRSMTRVFEGFLKNTKEDIRLLITLHDELMFEMKEKDIPRLLPKIANLMEDPETFAVPLTVDADWSPTSWGDKKPLDLGGLL